MLVAPSAISSLPIELDAVATPTRHSALSSQHSSRSGPRTPEGRAAVALNALSHGLSAERPVLPGESEAEWNALRAATLWHLTPQDACQAALAERAALSLWRLQRVARYETSATIAAFDRAPEDAAVAVNLAAAGFDSRDALVAAIEEAATHSSDQPEDGAARLDALQSLLDRLDTETERLQAERAIYPPDDVARRVHRYENQFQRQYNAAVKELRLLQQSRPPTQSTPAFAPDQPGSWELTEQFPTLDGPSPFTPLTTPLKPANPAPISRQSAPDYSSPHRKTRKKPRR